MEHSSDHPWSHDFGKRPTEFHSRGNWYRPRIESHLRPDKRRGRRTNGKGLIKGKPSGYVSTTSQMYRSFRFKWTWTLWTLTSHYWANRNNVWWNESCKFHCIADNSSSSVHRQIEPTTTVLPSETPVARRHITNRNFRRNPPPSTNARPWNAICSDNFPVNETVGDATVSGNDHSKQMTQLGSSHAPKKIRSQELPIEAGMYSPAGKSIDTNGVTSYNSNLIVSQPVTTHSDPSYRRMRESSKFG